LSSAPAAKPAPTAPPPTSTAEAEKAAAVLGATLEFIDLGGDAHFVPSLAHSLTIAMIIRRVRPGLVLVPPSTRTSTPTTPSSAKSSATPHALPATAASPNSGTPAHAIDTLLHYAITSDAEARDASPVLADVSPVARHLDCCHGCSTLPKRPRATTSNFNSPAPVSTASAPASPRPSRFGPPTRSSSIFAALSHTARRF